MLDIACLSQEARTQGTALLGQVDLNPTSVQFLLRISLATVLFQGRHE